MDLVYVGQLSDTSHPDGVRSSLPWPTGMLTPIYQNDRVTIYAIAGTPGATEPVTAPIVRVESVDRDLDRPSSWLSTWWCN